MTENFGKVYLIEVEAEKHLAAHNFCARSRSRASPTIDFTVNLFSLKARSGEPI